MLAFKSCETGPKPTRDGKASYGAGPADNTNWNSHICNVTTSDFEYLLT
jgi:hypothetical protein